MKQVRPKTLRAPRATERRLDDLSIERIRQRLDRTLPHLPPISARFKRLTGGEPLRRLPPGRAMVLTGPDAGRVIFVTGEE